MHLKRFAYDGTKIHCRVNIEERLELCKQHFVLTSVVLHQGSETIGHYFTFHRERDNQWVQLDDQLITRGINTKMAQNGPNATTRVSVLVQGGAKGSKRCQGSTVQQTEKSSSKQKDEVKSA